MAQFITNQDKLLGNVINDIMTIPLVQENIYV